MVFSKTKRTRATINWNNNIVTCFLVYTIGWFIVVLTLIDSIISVRSDVVIQLYTIQQQPILCIQSGNHCIHIRNQTKSSPVFPNNENRFETLYSRAAWICVFLLFVFVALSALENVFLIRIWVNQTISYWMYLVCRLISLVWCNVYALCLNWRFFIIRLMGLTMVFAQA